MYFACLKAASQISTKSNRLSSLGVKLCVFQLETFLIYFVWRFSFFPPPVYACVCVCERERDVIEALITQTLQHRNNLMHLWFCQTLPHSFDPNTAQRTPFHMLCSYHAAWFSLARTCKQGQTVVDRGRREAAKLPFIYLNIALKSPKPLSFKGKMIPSAKQPKYLSVSYWTIMPCRGAYYEIWESWRVFAVVQTFSWDLKTLCDCMAWGELFAAFLCAENVCNWKISKGPY